MDLPWWVEDDLDNWTYPSAEEERTMFEHKFKKNARVYRKRAFGDSSHGTILSCWPGADVYSVVFDDGNWGTAGILCTAEVLTLIAPVPDEPVSSAYSIVEQFNHIKDTQPYSKKVGSSVVILVNNLA